MSFNFPVSLFTPSKNDRGISVPVSSRVPPEMMRSIEEIVESEGSPWKTKSDFIRDAIFHFIQSVSDEGKLGNITPQIVTSLLAWQRKNYEREVVSMASDAILSTSSHIAVYLEYGNMSEAAVCLEEACSQIKRIPDGFWQQRTAKELFASPTVRRVAEALAIKGELNGNTRELYEQYCV